MRTGNFWFNRPTEENIESTSYGLMATLLMKGDAPAEALKEGMRIIKWLTNERNSVGGFASSQVCNISLIQIDFYDEFRA